MKFYFTDIIPRIQRFAKKLEDVSILTSKPWILLNDKFDNKVVFVFREMNNQLLISDMGCVEIASWEYVGNNYLMLSIAGEKYLFRHSLIDENILALKIDGKEEFAILVREDVYSNYLNTISATLSFLEMKYFDSSYKSADMQGRYSKFISIEEWRKLNPNRQINDYYTELNKTRNKH